MTRSMLTATGLRIAFILLAAIAGVASATPALADQSDSWVRGVFAKADRVSVTSTTKSGKWAGGKSYSGSGGGVKWVASPSCLDGRLRSAIEHVAANYGPVTVSSTCRSPSQNAKAGGAPKSYHLTGNAADLRVHGNSAAAAAYLRSQFGGFSNHGGLIHIDTGPRRPMT